MLQRLNLACQDVDWPETQHQHNYYFILLCLVSLIVDGIISLEASNTTYFQNIFYILFMTGEPFLGEGDTVCCHQ